MHRPDKFITIKQPRRSKLCGVAVVAMATGKTLDYARDRLRRKYGRHTGGLNLYLAQHGVMMGFAYAYDVESPEGRGSFLPRVYLRWDRDDHPAIIGVDSGNDPDWTHWVFWDGKVIRDPNPRTPDVRMPCEFEGKVIDVWPLTYLT